MNDVHVVNLGTESGKSADWDLESAVCHIQEVQGKHVVLNLEHVKIIDSRGLGKLVLTYHHLQRKKIRLSLLSPNDTVREMLEYVNLPKILPIFQSIDEISSEMSVADSIRISSPSS